MITIREIDSSKLHKEILDYGPVECMDCKFDKNIPVKYYLVEPEINTEKEYLELKKLIKKQLGFNSFEEASSDLGHLINVCRCPKCGSEKIFQDI